MPDLKKPEKYNFNYTFSGPERIAQLKYLMMVNLHILSFHEKIQDYLQF